MGEGKQRRGKRERWVVAMIIKIVEAMTTMEEGQFGLFLN